MSLGTWFESGYQKNYKEFDYVDIAFIKLGCIIFGLMIAKLWMPLLSLDWYWYAILFILLSIRPAYKALKK